MTMSWDEARDEALAVQNGQTRSHVEAAGRLAAFVVGQGDQLRKELDAALAVNARNIAHDADAVPLHIQLTDELRKAQAQITTLQAEATARQEATLYRTVRYFHQRFGHPVEHTPKVPDGAQLRFRLKLVAEEFFEFLAACEIWPTTRIDGQELTAAELVRNAIDCDFVDPGVVDLPELVDAMADLAYVVEGTSAVLGVLMAPVHALVHAANMAKLPEQVTEKDDHHRQGTRIKPVKPEGWKPPDIAAELRRQGWNP
ncbi:MAG: hypothetical protein M3Z05_21900 [Gemmatimonadota bacterium]|nr:hypothetical protein [Gemmatimonadota bacterium]